MHVHNRLLTFFIIQWLLLIRSFTYNSQHAFNTPTLA